MRAFGAAIYRVLILVLFLLSLPLQLCLVLVVIVTSGWPALYIQKRTGKGGKPFRMYKLRTMVKNAEEKKHTLQRLNEAAGPVFKIRNDPRFTRLGKFLSHTGLDELPQFWNVLKGEMALIGPRPLPLDETKKLKAWQQKRYTVLPGIVSPWVLDGHNHRQFVAWMKSDIAYSQHKNATGDTVLFLRAGRLLARLVFCELIGKA